MVEPHVWEGLSLYESTDLVARFYKEHHGSRLKEEKANEIVSQLAQGREYFSSASRSAEIVRPLLVYYGALSLTRGLILFLEQGLRETHLAHGHGLEPLHWSQQLLRGGIGELPNLQVTFRKGTFPELGKATGNRERSEVYKGDNFPAGESYHHLYEQDGTLEIPLGTTLAFKDILSRLPDLEKVYEHTFGEYSGCYPTVLFINTSNNHANVAVLESRGYGLEEKVIRDALRIPPDTPLRHQLESHYLGIYDVGHWLFDVPFSSERDLMRRLPVVREASDGGYFFVTPLPDDLKLSSLSLLLITSYVMGMLVRYYPSQWLAVLGRSKGDFSLPLLKAAMSVVEQRFPDLLLQELESRNAVTRRRQEAAW